MAVQPLHVVIAVSDQDVIANSLDYFPALQKEAAEQLAETIIRDAARYTTRKSAPEDPARCTYHSWLVGVERDMSVLEAKQKAAEENRLKGRREAANILREEYMQSCRRFGFHFETCEALARVIRKLETVE